MKKCLFIFSDNPASFWHSGTSNRAAMDLISLCKLGLEVHVLRLLDEQYRQEVEDYERRYSDEAARIRGLTASWEDLDYRRSNGRKSGMKLIQGALFDPVDLVHAKAASLTEVIRSSIANIKPDVIWSEWVPSSPGVYYAKPSIPWVCVHTDWMFQLMKIRRARTSLKGKLKLKLLSWSSKRADLHYLKMCSAIETGSTLQAEEMRAFNLRNVHVIPQTYEAIDIDLSENGKDKDALPRINHLGSLETTSNRTGMISYLERVHPVLKGRLASQNLPFELRIIGDVSKVKNRLSELLEESGAICTGFVYDLGSVLRPFDIQIIPYEFSTGLRSKAALLFRHAQVVVSTRAAVAGMPEMVSGENCVLLPSLNEFPDALEKLTKSPEKRMKIGRNARATFEKEFLLDAQMDRYRAILKSL